MAVSQLRLGFVGGFIVGVLACPSLGQVGGDFNGDGFQDVAIGVPFEDVGAVVDAGGVHVFYSRSSGITKFGDQFWTQDSAGVIDTAEAGDHFGAALAVGDFNGDGFDDLAIGVPDEDLSAPVAGGAIANAGAVNVLYGSSNGLTKVGDQFWHKDQPGIVGSAAAGDQFGFSLAVGDFDNDGFDDLAIGVPGEDVTPALAGGPVADAGAVNVLYGRSSRLSKFGDQQWHQDSPFINGAVGAGDNFGSALATGDFDGDGFDDLAVGVPNEDVGAATGAGAVNIIRGSSDKLTHKTDQFWTQDSAGIIDVSETDDAFGSSLAAGDFDGDGFDDLAIGVPGEDIPAPALAGVPISNAGAVNVLYGRSSGLSKFGDQFWTQDSPGIVDTAEADDEFGRVLKVGDFDGDGFDDLAIGVPLEDVGAVADAGAVNVLYGRASKLRKFGDQFWNQDVAGMLDSAVAFDNFGNSLAVGDFNGDGFDDLVIGVPGEDVAAGPLAGGAITDAGAIAAIYGSSGKLTVDGNQHWTQDSTGIVDSSETSDFFGDIAGP